jgi:phage baseplate assembly protein V
MNIKDLRKVMAPLSRRIRMLAGRGSVAMSDDTGRIQKLQLTVLNGERISEVARVQQFGHSSRPPKGSTCVVLCMSGSRTYPLVIAVDDPASRPTGLDEGESILYNAFGDYAKLDKDGNFRVHASTKVYIDSPEAEFTGNVTVDKNLTVRQNAEVVQNLVVDENATVKGILYAQGVDGSGVSINATGHIFSGGDVRDSVNTMASMRVVYNGHTQPVVGGTAEAPPAQMT